MRINEDIRNAGVNETDDLINTGAGTAVLELRTGAPATAITDAAAGTLLASFNLPNPALEAAAAGEADFNSLPLASTWLDDGDVGHFRIVNRNGDCVLDGDAVLPFIGNSYFADWDAPAGASTSGTYTITWDGETTSALAWNHSHEDLQAALEALSNIGAGNVTVVSDGEGNARVNLVGDRANETWPDPSAANVSGDANAGISPAFSYGGDAELALSTLTAVNGEDVEITAAVVIMPEA